ncbi:unnamed protein product [Psylliodes chrysocephalus]|uniref:Uncharacterized protein n=1 Tax=Psylliodes chrysocephalus TaxID=3402493 RepID=A0A9P0D9K9_9CUCU|nr:unnamed protein product [Psylliodes chrysocephala]
MLNEERPVQDFIEEQRVKMINYIQNFLKDGSHPRKDYKELLQLSPLYLGSWSQDEFSFRIPGALHQTRWIAKAIYALKIVLFTKQLNMTQRELKEMKRDAHFVSLIYLLNIYPGVYVKKNALTVAKKHLRYLSETIVGLAFLNERISQIEKENMMKHLETKPQNKKEMKRLDDEKLSF